MKRVNFSNITQDTIKHQIKGMNYKEERKPASDFVAWGFILDMSNSLLSMHIFGLE